MPGPRLIDEKRALDQLLTGLVSMVDEALRSGQVHQVDRKVLRYRNEDGTDGAVTPKLSGQVETEKSWELVAIAIAEVARKLPSYSDAEKVITVRMPIGASLTDWFARNAVLALLKDAQRPCPSARIVVDQALTYIGGARQKYHSTLTMAGVRIPDGDITFNTPTSTIALRGARLSDFDREVTAQYFHPTRELSPFEVDCIGQIDTWADGPNSLHVESTKLVSLLRLYHVCSARYITRDDEIVDPLKESLGHLGTGDREIPHECATLSRPDIGKLEQLAQRLWQTLPPDEGIVLRDQPWVAISYQRYCDALGLKSPLIERRVANVMMGLEGLYLQGDPDGELSYRLSIRVSRLLACLGLDGATTFEETRMGYAIRSVHVHGRRLEGRLASKCDRLYGGVQKLLPRLENYLRVSVLVFLLHSDKDALLSQVDRALVSADAADALKKDIITVSEEVPLNVLTTEVPVIPSPPSPSDLE